MAESINHTGRKLATTRLGSQHYGGKDADSFFSYCYGIRSRLVHGQQPIPDRAEVGSAAASLEVFVSDLLAGELTV